MAPRIYSKRDKNIPAEAKYVGRNGSNYGNPFVIGPDGDRTTVCSKFRSWLITGETFGNKDATEKKRQWILSHVQELRGSDLVCWCWPKECHASTLLELANK